MIEQDVYARLTPIFREIFEHPTMLLTPELSAADVPAWDSFVNINIIVAAEQEFGVEFTTNEVESFRCVGDLVAAILHRKEQ